MLPLLPIFAQACVLFHLLSLSLLSSLLTKDSGQDEMVAVEETGHLSLTKAG